MAEALRRTRSVGDLPRTPDPAVLHASAASEYTARDVVRSGSQEDSVPPSPIGAQGPAPAAATMAHTPYPLDDVFLEPNPRPSHESTPPAIPVLPALRAAHNLPLYTRIMTFFGYGRGASRTRKQLVSMCYNLVWGFVQVVVIISVISVAAHTESKTMPGLNEWKACDRPLGVWACLYIVRVVYSSCLTYWGWRRDVKAHVQTSDPEHVGAANIATSVTAVTSADSGNGSTTPAATGVTLPHVALYSRLSILSSLITLSWFLTAHILEYSSVHTCRYSSPHIWWLTFGLLCIMYLVVLEVILLGFIVFVVAPIVFLFWNVFLMCLGRHPMQNPPIRPEIGKLSASVVDRIPLVLYIPPPPDALPGSIPLPQSAYSYPPKLSAKPPARKHHFRFLRRKRDQTSDKAGPTASPGDGIPGTWQENWEQGPYPFVILEGNRAACAVCLMDFEEPKRIADTASSQPQSSETVVEAAQPQSGSTLRLEDAGEGAQPLRLLECGHVFHKTCLDPWLTDVSGRCPVCQRAVELPKPDKKQKGRR